jgi:O-antigen ligase
MERENDSLFASLSLLLRCLLSFSMLFFSFLSRLCPSQSAITRTWILYQRPPPSSPPPPSEQAFLSYLFFFFSFLFFPFQAMSFSICHHAHLDRLSAPSSFLLFSASFRSESQCSSSPREARKAAELGPCRVPAGFGVTR